MYRQQLQQRLIELGMDADQPKGDFVFRPYHPSARRVYQPVAK